MASAAVVVGEFNNPTGPFTTSELQTSVLEQYKMR